MLLQKLIESRKSTLPKEYKKQGVNWIIDLNINGKPVYEPITPTVGDNNRPMEIPVPFLRRSGANIPPQLLCDKTEFIFGKGEKLKRAKKRHQLFLGLVQGCAIWTNSEQVKAVANCLNECLLDDYWTEDFSEGDFFTFRVDGKLVVELKEVQNFWAQFCEILDAEKPKEITGKWVVDILKNGSKKLPEKQECIVCGNIAVPQKKHPIPIKLPRIVTDQQGSIVTGKIEATHSYGLKKSLIAPTCRSCSTKYAENLNHLLIDEDSHLTVGKQVYVFWSKGEDFSPVKALQNPEDFFGGLQELGREDDPAKVKEMFKSAFGGKTGAIDDHENVFYAAAFSAAGGRVVVRDWIETTIPKVKQNLIDFFASCYHKYQRHPHGIYSLASATVRDVHKELPSRTLIQLLHVAIKGTHLPEDLLYQAIKRAISEQGKYKMNNARAALIKLYFQSNHKQKEVSMAQLDTKTHKPAYLCGRLLATLEEIQSAALGSTNTTIVDRYYGTASTAPATVFSVLLTGARHHLGKLRKERPGQHINLEKKIQRIVSGLSEFPKVLTLEEQGLFALGYYHQKQERFQKSENQESE